MVYEMHHDGVSGACGHGVYGGLDSDGHPQWWVEGYSLREYNERTPPTIDWKRSPMCNYITQRHAFLSLEPVSNFEFYVKSKMPKGVRKYFETLLQAPTFAQAPAEKYACDSCGKVYIQQKSLDKHIKSGVCVKSSPSAVRSAVRAQSTVPFPRYAVVTYPTQFPPLIPEDLNEWARGQEPPDIDAFEKNDSQEEGHVDVDQLVGALPGRMRKTRTVNGDHTCKHCGQKFKVLGWYSKHESACEGKMKRELDLASTHPNEEAAIKPAQEPVVRSKTTSSMKGPPEKQGVKRKDSKPMELPNSVQRVVSRFWNPIDAEKGFTWSELESIGNKILDGTTFLRLHYKMRPGVRCTTDLESMTVADGALYVRKGEIWVHYPDPDFCTREHLDVTADCCILMVEELKSSIWGM